MKYTQSITIGKTELDTINHYLSVEPKSEKECLGEDETIMELAKFPNGYEMEIKCCGVQFWEGESNLAWSEAILFTEDGYEISCTEPSDNFAGIWELEDGEGNTYIAEVKVA